MSLNILPPRPRPTPRETVRIVLSMSLACLVGAAVLGLFYLGTDRYLRASAEATERTTLRDMLGLDQRARLLEVRQFLVPAARHVVYRAAALGATSGRAREVTFTLDGALAGERDVPVAAPVPREWTPLGRTFVAFRADAGAAAAPALGAGGSAVAVGTDSAGAPAEPAGLAGFVAQGETRGYKAPIRLFVAMRPDFEIVDMRVVEVQDDPGLGAEVAQPWFREQYVGRTAEEIARLDVTRDPMPEDWRQALVAFARRAPDGPARHRDLLQRERSRPIYAVTGATISSRAVTEGVRKTMDHFRRRWWLLAPHLEGVL